MKENKDNDLQNGHKIEEFSLKEFFKNMIFGFPIGVAFIIPGFSGGSVAAILGIYEKMINAITEIFRRMKRSILTLMPIGIGLVIGAVSLLFPLGWALDSYAIPTVSLFVGLAIGGIPAITDKISGKPSGKNIAAFLIPFAVAIALCFIPTGADVNLFDLNIGGYALLFLVGMLGSAALVVPGISGSMLLLILGYYNPIIKMITQHFFRGEDLTSCRLVFASCGAGIGVGFLLISFVMKFMLSRYPRGTYFAIVGFIIGSLPTVYVSTMKDAGMLSSAMKLVWLPSSPVYWISSVILVALGILASYSLVRYSRKHENR